MALKRYFDVNQLPCVLEIREAGLYLACDTGTLTSLARKGLFPAYKFHENGKWMVDRDDMLAWQSERKAKYIHATA